MPQTTGPAQELLDQLRADCDYHPDGEGGLDDLIAYKDGLEDLIGGRDGLAAKAAAWDRLSADLHANSAGTLTAADVCAAGFALQAAIRLGADPRTVITT